MKPCWVVARGIFGVLLLVQGLALCQTSEAKGKPQEGFYAAHAFYTDRPAPSPDGSAVVTLRRLRDDAEDFPTEVKVSVADRTFTGTISFAVRL
jgi:hypothetical protein